MVGILLLSHGSFAKGLKESSNLFFGDDIPKLEALCYSGDDVEDFDRQIDEAIRRLDDGSGVLILCDLYGGTPANRCAYKISDRVKVITGVNFVMLLDALGRRMNVRKVQDIDLNHIMESGKKCIVCINDFYKKN